VEVFSDSQAAIRQTAHMDPGPGQQLTRAIYEHAMALHTEGIDIVIYWVPGHSGIPGNVEADREANKARDSRGYTLRERIDCLSANRARQITDVKTAVKAEWQTNWCSKYYGYRLKGKAGNTRPVPMTSVESLAAMFYRLKSGHALTGVYLKWFGHREDDICLWCRGGAVQTWEHLFRHCSRWNNQQKALWKTVGKATGWKVGRCRHVQISELCSMEICDQAVMDFLAATDVGKFPPRQAEERGQEERVQEERGQEERGQEERGQEESGQEERE